MFEKDIEFIRSQYGNAEKIALHEPYFDHREIEKTTECIESTFVSSVGKFVTEFENSIAEYCGVKRAVACVNGTNALFLALKLCGVNAGDKVVTQPLTFIATANAIAYCGAEPIFVDVDKDTMGLSPEHLETYLKKHNDVKAVAPMHTFGHPCCIKEIKDVCDRYGVVLVEDCAESLGSFVGDVHTGNFGRVGILSFNGNKIITTGGGGMLLFNDEKLADYAKHLTTQAKIPHRWEFNHDAIGYNYRMPNLNAALGMAQFEKLPMLRRKKRELAERYAAYFGGRFVKDTDGTSSNYWLNAILTANRKEREIFLTETNDAGVMTRPAWTLMNKLEMFKHCETDGLENAQWLEDRLVNIPSGVMK